MKAKIKTKDPWKFFPELTQDMEVEFMVKLHAMRVLCDFPLPVTSGYRSPQYNAQVSTTGRSGPHTTGRAADIRCSGSQAQKVLETAILVGMTGIGVSQKGPHVSRFIHVDDLPQGPNCPRPWVWSY